MILKELPLPFPIYKRRERQHRFRRNAYGRIITGVLCPKDALLPFQFRLEGMPSIPVVSDWKLAKINCVSSGSGSGDFLEYDFSDDFFILSGAGSSLTITLDVLTDENGDPMQDENGDPIYTGESSISGEDYDLSSKIPNIYIAEHNGAHNIYYNGNQLNLNLACGFYEMFIKLSNGDSFWSEIFRVVEYNIHEMPFVELNWGNPVNLSKIIYGNLFQNKIYLDTYISHSEPQLLEEVEKDGLDKEIVVFAKMTNRYLFSEVVPDFLKTALSAIAICRSVYFIDPKANIFLEATRVRTTSTPELSQFESFIEVQMEVDDEIYRMACE